MSARGRAEAVLALAYMLAFPFAFFAGISAQLVVFDATWSPTLPYALVLLLDVLPVVLTSVLFFMLVRIVAHERLPDESFSRWPVRLAPLLVAAAIPTGIGFWLVVVEGQPGLKGLIVLSALVAWGGIVGEWIAHTQLARGRDGGALFGRLFLCGAVGIGSLMITAWILRSPQGEVALARQKCERSYAEARTAADSSNTDIWTPTVGRRLGTRSCADLLSDVTPR